MYGKIHIFFDDSLLNTAASKIFEGNLKEFMLFLKERKQLGNLPPLCKSIAAAEHKTQLAYYLRNADWFQRCSEFGFFDEPVIILFTIFY